MKKVLEINNYMYPHIGGIEQTTRDIANVIEDDYEVKIICFNHEKKTFYDKVDDIDVIRVGCQAKISSQSIALTFGRELKKIMKAYNPDIVIFHYPNPFEAHFLVKYLKHKTFKFVLYYHSDIINQKILGKLFEGQTKKLLKYADRVVSTSPNYIEGSKHLLSVKSKVIVIPSCIDEERLRYGDEEILRASKLKEKYKDKKLCFAFGRHVTYKGLTYLIKAGDYLSENYMIFIGGKGKLTKELKDEAKNKNNIKFLGRLSDSDLKSYFIASDVFCFPSITKNEAFGLGLAEALYYGLPAVTFKIEGSGVNFVNLNRVTGLEVENKNSEAFAKAIIDITTSNNDYAINAKKRVNELFLKKTFKINILNMLKDLYNEKNSN